MSAMQRLYLVTIGSPWSRHLAIAQYRDRAVSPWRHAAAVPAGRAPDQSCII
jgi:hypothetical protein